ERARGASSRVGAKRQEQRRVGVNVEDGCAVRIGCGSGAADRRLHRARSGAKQRGEMTKPTLEISGVDDRGEPTPDRRRIGKERSDREQWQLPRKTEQRR